MSKRVQTIEASRKGSAEIDDGESAGLQLEDVAFGDFDLVFFYFIMKLFSKSKRISSRFFWFG
jgi:hypothetical protein